MARRNAVVVAVTLLMASVIAIAAAPAQAPRGEARKPAVIEPETNEQVVADFLVRKDRAEKAQRTIILNLRKSVDQKRLEFEQARKKFDDARNRYVDIVGPLAKQGVMNPEDPRLPYEFEMLRSGPELAGVGPGYPSRKGTESARK